MAALSYFTSSQSLSMADQAFLVALESGIGMESLDFLLADGLNLLACKREEDYISKTLADWGKSSGARSKSLLFSALFELPSSDFYHLLRLPAMVASPSLNDFKEEIKSHLLKCEDRNAWHSRTGADNYIDEIHGIGFAQTLLEAISVMMERRELRLATRFSENSPSTESAASHPAIRL